MMSTIILLIKVVPSSGKQLIMWDEKNQILKCYVKSAPEKNQANDEVVRLFSKKLGIGVSFISIVGGATARRKKVALSTQLSLAAVHGLLGIGDEWGIRQQSIS